MARRSAVVAYAAAAAVLIELFGLIETAFGASRGIRVRGVGLAAVAAAAMFVVALVARRGQGVGGARNSGKRGASDDGFGIDPTAFTRGLLLMGFVATTIGA